jgi:hypothetical protein
MPEVGPVEFALQPGSAAVGFPEFEHGSVDLGLLVGADGKCAHLLQPASRDLTMLGPGLGQLAYDQIGERRQHGERVDLFVDGDQSAPGVGVPQLQ